MFKMEKFVEIGSSGEVVLDKEIISILEPKATRLKCVFDGVKILLIPETSQDYVARGVRGTDIAATVWDKVSLQATLKRLELEHKERIDQGNLVEEFEQLVQKGKVLIEQIDTEWQEPEDIVRKMRERREVNLMEGLGCEKL